MDKKEIIKNMIECDEKGASYWDIEETIPNCIVQTLKNSVTGDESFAWKRNNAREQKDKIIGVLRKFGIGIPEGQIIVIANQIMKELDLDDGRAEVGD